MNAFFLKLLILLITSYWWFPLMKLIVDEIWRVGDQNADHDEQEYQLSAGHKRGSEGWKAANAEERNPSNASWSIGRRPVVRRSQAFANNSQSSSGLSSFGRRKG
jgi:hypothetical protein